MSYGKNALHFALVALVIIIFIASVASNALTGAWGFGNWGGPKTPDKVCHKLALNQDKAVSNIVGEPVFTTQDCLDSGGTYCYMKNPCTGEMDSFERYLDITGLADYRYVFGNGDVKGSLATTFYTACVDGRSEIHRNVYAQGYWARYRINVCDSM
jgi:hypothetical protein